MFRYYRRLVAEKYNAVLWSRNFAFFITAQRVVNQRKNIPAFYFIPRIIKPPENSALISSSSSISGINSSSTSWARMFPSLSFTIVLVRRTVPLEEYIIEQHPKSILRYRPFLKCPGSLIPSCWHIFYSSTTSIKKLTGLNPSLQLIIADLGFRIQPS